MTLQENGRFFLSGPITTSKVTRDGGRLCFQGEAERRKETLLLSNFNKINSPPYYHHEPRTASSFPIFFPFNSGKAGPKQPPKGTEKVIAQ